MEAKKLAERLAWHAVAYQSIATAQLGEDELLEAARETLHVTTDALAVILPIDEQVRIANQLEKSELEGQLPENKRSLDDIIRYVFVCRLQEYVEAEYLQTYITERLNDPCGKIKIP